MRRRRGKAHRGGAPGPHDDVPAATRPDGGGFPPRRGRGAPPHRRSGKILGGFMSHIRATRQGALGSLTAFAAASGAAEMTGAQLRAGGTRGIASGGVEPDPRRGARTAEGRQRRVPHRCAPPPGRQSRATARDRGAPGAVRGSGRLLGFAGLARAPVRPRAGRAVHHPRGGQHRRFDGARQHRICRSASRGAADRGARHERCGAVANRPVRIPIRARHGGRVPCRSGHSSR